MSLKKKKNLYSLYFHNWNLPSLCPHSLTKILLNLNVSQNDIAHASYVSGSYPKSS